MMGCLCAKAEDVEEIPAQKYSWEKKSDEVSRKDLTVEDIQEETIVRLPGSINGQQFIIQNCKNSLIFLYDHIGSVTVDDCRGCTIFIGPTRGSVFVRNCRECRMQVCCGQFRSRDCRSVDALLCCATQPVIEACSRMRFACFRYNYPQLRDQFRSAHLSIFNNDWNDIHDFTPSDDGERNWSLFSKDLNVEEMFPSPVANNELFVQTELLNSLVPQTYRHISSPQRSLVVFFSSSESEDRALELIRDMQKSGKTVLRTAEMALDPCLTDRIFGNSVRAEDVAKGRLIAVEIGGLVDQPPEGAVVLDGKAADALFASRRV